MNAVLECPDDKDSGKEFYGRTITDVKVLDEVLTLTFKDGSACRILDNGQSCCESRYMTTDDNLVLLVGHILLRITLKDGPDRDDCGDVHEQQFVEISTTGGLVTLVNHNEHNGYYGGFNLSVEAVQS